MKIISSLTYQTSKTERSSQASTGAAPAKTQAKAQDSVRVSQVAMEIAAEVSQNEPVEAADTTRLQRLRQQIEDGSYELDPKRIAAAILEDEL